jgi:transposase
MLDGEMRIGILVSEKGRDEVWLPHKVFSSKKKAKELQSQRDLLFEKIKKKTLEMLPSDLPGELKANWDRAKQPRLIKIMKYLREQNHFLVKELERWHEKDRRFYNEISGLTARALRHRKWSYYNEANRICDRFGTIVVGKLDLAEMSKKEKADGSANELVKQAKEYRTIAALGEFLKLLHDVAAKRKAVLTEVDSAYTTMKCHVCGTIFKPADRSKLEWNCPTCDALYDQDVNAAMNLYADLHAGDANTCNS